LSHHIGKTQVQLGEPCSAVIGHFHIILDTVE
jgi:hypothetical protein